jgi:hypothetical protein
MTPSGIMVTTYQMEILKFVVWSGVEETIDGTLSLKSYTLIGSKSTSINTNDAVTFYDSQKGCVVFAGGCCKGEREEGDAGWLRRSWEGCCCGINDRVCGGRLRGRGEGPVGQARWIFGSRRGPRSGGNALGFGKVR